MENRIYEAYQKFNSGNYTKEEIKPLIERVYLISIAIHKYKNNGNGVSEKELEELAIDATANLLSMNGNGLPVLANEMDKEEIIDAADFGFKLILIAKNIFVQTKTLED